LFYDAVLTVEQNSPDPADPLPPISMPYGEKYSAYHRVNFLVEASDRKVIILAKSLEIEPVNGARITVNNIAFAIITYDDGESNRSV
jgi:hypothetical protein